MWFELNGDERLGRCATEGCGGQPIYRLEADGVGSNYCSWCQAQIRAIKASNPAAREIFTEEKHPLHPRIAAPRAKQ